MNKNDTIDFKELGFDGEKYIELQKNQILDRMANMSWRLYLEIWWKFLRDTHASRCLPWYDPESMKKIFWELKDKIEILFCVNAEDIISDKKIWWSTTYSEYLETRFMVIERNTWVKPILVINNIDIANMFDLVLEFERKFQKKQYRVFERYKIQWYPYNLNSMLSENWFGADDHIPLTKNLIIVTSATPNSWKFSCCLWQIYLDNEMWIRAWYAKFETFPILNLWIDHPSNLAFQAAICDQNDNVITDEYHKNEYKQECVSTEKDIQAFEILQKFAKETVNHKNYMIKYKSSVDMMINCTWMCITDDDLIKKASSEEILRRKERYKEIGDDNAARKCEMYYQKATQEE